MGLLKDAITNGIANGISNAVKGLATDAAMTALSATVDAADRGTKALSKLLGDPNERTLKQEEKYLAKVNGQQIFFIQKDAKPHYAYIISSHEGEERYLISKKAISATVDLKFSDAHKNQLASIHKTFFAKRNNLLHEIQPANYSIEVNGQPWATVKTKLSTEHTPFEVEPFGWPIKGNSLKWEYTILNGEQELAHISRRPGYSHTTFILDFTDPAFEVYAALISLALISYSEP